MLIQLEKGDAITLSGATSSRLHKLVEAFRRNQVLYGLGKGSEGRPFVESMDEGLAWASFLTAPGTVPFVIKHDWASALGEAITPLADDEWNLPARVCVFELTGRMEGISRHQIFAIGDIRESEIHKPDYMAINFSHIQEWDQFVWGGSATGRSFLELSRSLTSWDDPEVNAVLRGILLFCRAACIALDSSVAETEIVPVPEKLRAARARRDKPPMLDYKIIKLATRFNTARSAHEPTGRHVRLHFRRGHWWPRLSNETSKFAEHRHWRPWQFVGDPDLGFIEHEYRI